MGKKQELMSDGPALEPESPAEIIRYRNSRMKLFLGEYGNLLDRGHKFSLKELFHLPPSAEQFRPCSFGEQAENEIENWAKEVGVWLPNFSEGTNSMMRFLHSDTISFERAVLIGKFYILLFYVDDLYGNSKKKKLNEDEQKSIADQLANINILLGGGQIEVATPLEIGTLQVLQGFQDQGLEIPRDWLERFIAASKEHLNLATVDQNTEATGTLHTEESFNVARNIIGGFYTSILLDEFSRNMYYDRDVVERLGVTEKLKTLQFTCATIGCFMNELFSLEMEVVDDEDDFNLTTVLFLQNSQSTVLGAIVRVADIVNENINAFLVLAKELRDEVSGNNTVNDDFKDEFLAHIIGLENMINASWFWEVWTNRYERLHSIFLELTKDSREELVRELEEHWEKLESPTA
jgi:hypothetical protein